MKWVHWELTGWFVGTVIAVAIAGNWRPPWLISAALGFGLSFAGLRLGRFIQRRFFSPREH